MIDAAPRSVTRVRGPSAATREKAARYVAEGRVRRIALRPGLELYAVDGDSGRWLVRAEHGGLRCECPATFGVCAHTTAVALLDHARGRTRRATP